MSRSKLFSLNFKCKRVHGLVLTSKDAFILFLPLIQDPAFDSFFLFSASFFAKDIHMMGMSHFLPGGGAEWDYEDNPLEKVYFVLDGEISVKSKTKEIVLRKYDSLFLGPNEGREIINRTNIPASMLVVINYPE